MNSCWERFVLMQEKDLINKVSWSMILSISYWKQSSCFISWNMNIFLRQFFENCSGIIWLIVKLFLFNLLKSDYYLFMNFTHLSVRQINYLNVSNQINWQFNLQINQWWSNSWLQLQVVADCRKKRLKNKAIVLIIRRNLPSYPRKQEMFYIFLRLLYVLLTADRRLILRKLIRNNLMEKNNQNILFLPLKYDNFRFSSSSFNNY